MAVKTNYRLGFGETGCFIAKIENSVITEKSEIQISYEIWVKEFNKVMEEDPKLRPKEIIFKAAKNLGYTPIPNGNSKYMYNYNNSAYYNMLKEYVLETKKEEYLEERRRHKEYVEERRNFFNNYVKVPQMYNNPHKRG